LIAVTVATKRVPVDRALVEILELGLVALPVVIAAMAM
jgi:hypothetical protein